MPASKRQHVLIRGQHGPGRVIEGRCGRVQHRRLGSVQARNSVVLRASRWCLRWAPLGCCRSCGQLTVGCWLIGAMSFLVSFKNSVIDPASCCCCRCCCCAAAAAGVTVAVHGCSLDSEDCSAFFFIFCFTIGKQLLQLLLPSGGMAGSGFRRSNADD